MLFDGENVELGGVALLRIGLFDSLQLIGSGGCVELAGACVYVHSQLELVPA